MIKDTVFYTLGTLFFLPGIYATLIAVIDWIVYLLIETLYARLIEYVDCFTKKYIACVLKNPNNYTFITHMIITLTSILPAIIWIHVIILCNCYEWYHLVLYHIILYGPMNKFFATVAVLAHKEGHHHESGLYVHNSFLLNKFFEYTVGIFYGIVPTIFSFSHRKIHHKYNGGHGDTVSIYDCDRSDIFHFIWYLTRFLLHSLNISNIAYVFYRDIHGEMRTKTLLGSIYYYLVICVYLYIDLTLAFIVIIMPLLMTNFFFATFNWCWHGFLDDTKKPYITNTTILSGNNNIWGEDYHVQHHINPVDDWKNNEIKYKKDDNMGKIESDSTIFYYTNAFSLWLFMMAFPFFDFPLVSSSLGYQINFDTIKNYRSITSNREYISRRDLLRCRIKKTLPYPDEFKVWYVFL